MVSIVTGFFKILSLPIHSYHNLPSCLCKSKRSLYTQDEGEERLPFVTLRRSMLEEEDRSSSFPNWSDDSPIGQMIHRDSPKID